MAKKTKKVAESSPSPVPVAPVWPGMMPQIPFGGQALQFLPPPMSDRSIISESIVDSEITLDDGSVITFKPTVQGIKQLDGQKGPKGEPVYVVQLSWTIQVTPKPKKAKAKRTTVEKIEE